MTVIAQTHLVSRFQSLTDLPRVNVCDVLFQAFRGRSGDSIAYKDPRTGQSLSFDDLKRKVTLLTYTLVHTMGLDRGATVLLYSANSLHYPVVMLAVLAAGLVCSPANAHFKEGELLQQITDSGASVIIAGHDQMDVVDAVCERAGVSKVFLMEKSESLEAKHPCILDILGEEILDPVELSEQDVLEMTALLCYSSGTSGKPKGVKTTHYNLTSALLQLSSASPRSFSSSEVWIACLPMSHMYAAFFHIFMASYIGAKIIVLPKFSAETFLSTINQYRVTAAYIVPPMALQLTKRAPSAIYSLPSLREWRTAAAPMPRDVQYKLECIYGAPVHTIYAMTETTAMLAITVQGQQMPPGASGLLGPNMEAKICDGELLVKGPNITLGYHNRPEANMEAFDSDGFLRTGDLVTVDEAGHIYVFDRSKDTIKVNGYQVAPVEVENILRKHKDVYDAAVIGVHDVSRATDVPLACVVLHDEVARRVDAAELEIKRRELSDLVAQQLAHFKHLRGGVHFVDKIPTSAAGKILRRVLLEDLRASGVIARES